MCVEYYCFKGYLIIINHNRYDLCYHTESDLCHWQKKTFYRILFAQVRNSYRDQNLNLIKNGSQS